MEAEQPQRRDGRTRDTRERIHGIALELFVTQGFANTTMQDIADRLGLTKAALYYHFPTKRDLIRSILQPGIDDVEAFLSDTERETLSRREILERFFDLNYAHRTAFLALSLDPSGMAELEVENWIPRLAATFQRLLFGPDATNEDRIRAVIVANGLSRCATLFTDIPHDELRAKAVNVAMQTLTAPQTDTGSHPGAAAGAAETTGTPS
ncbi:TetR/AcrR family transcriptional regulator [Actinobacteria bacterium YIM 96077]|uniref:TetR/AcrR family transcriptional regulator n=1 Tax=Phytoactinopolyspora halophila TaxID=1981511 RepID=A0A329QD72_9ACTN|nr:TetR/AcrR family transcriptional regulator [Phytoactinopolyspora halophila]AYY14181.1 TetR/AcrR family transcriptional regulator [Actinobacteria bacterium YIM 96077]RAW10227.1 TetR/AcrR family transcriptional regulator [Phytoactinopolyspora halophila]